MPRLTLQRRVFLTLAALLFALLLVFALLTRLGLQRGLGAYVAQIELDRLDWLVETLENRYLNDGGTWTVLVNSPALWRRVLRPGHPGEDDGGGGPRGLPPRFGPPPDGLFRPPPGGGSPGPGAPFAPPQGPMPDRDGHFPPNALPARLSLLDASGQQRLTGAPFDAAVAIRRPLRHGNVTVGYLALTPVTDTHSDADRAFLAQQSHFIAIAGLSGLVLALVMSWLLGRRWLAPVTALMEGAQEVAQGRLETRVPVHGDDELAALAQAFNTMAGQLASVEASRRRWLSDVAHELRTPLAALRAEIEALQDGVRPLGPEATARLHRQVMRLGQLVDDLRASMDAPSLPMIAPLPVQPLALLADSAESMAGRFVQAGIALDTAALHALAARVPAVVRGDAGRLCQVFLNLLENTLRYTRAPGRLTVQAERLAAGAPGALPGQPTLAIAFDDSAPAPTAQDLPRLFERFYRGESSRSRDHGGSGLGLSICRALVEAHGGTLAASASTLGGLRLTLDLPCEDTIP